MNSNFSARLTRRDGQTTPRLIHLNACLKRVKARMNFGLQETSDLLNSSEEFVLFFGVHDAGVGDYNIARAILEDLVDLEHTVAKNLTGASARALVVNFLGETLMFTIADISICSITADQLTSYVEYEVRLTLVGPE